MRRDAHADAVAIEMGNLYAAWCARRGPRARFRLRLQMHAGRAAASSLPDLRSGARHHFIAATVDLLTTGVDVPCVRNIVFFRYVKSPIAFYQMVGRGTRMDPTTNKLMFTVYDYTNATRLFGEAFRSQAMRPRKSPAEAAADDGGSGPPPERVVLVEGFDVHVTDAGRYLLTEVDGKATPVTVEEYAQRLTARLVAEAPTLGAFRSCWVSPPCRKDLLGRMPDAGRSAWLVRSVLERTDCDLYDVLAELGYGLAPRTRVERAAAFAYKHGGWLATLPGRGRDIILALAAQFARGGAEALENPQVFQTPEVIQAGGLAALKELGKPAEVLAKPRKGCSRHEQASTASKWEARSTAARRMALDADRRSLRTPDGDMRPRADPTKPFTYIDISSVDNQAKRIVAPKTLLGAEAPSRARQVVQTNDVLVSTTRPNLNAVAWFLQTSTARFAAPGFPCCGATAK